MEIKKVMKNTYVAFLRYEILKAQLTYKCGRVVPFCTSVYFAISKLVLLFSYSLHVLCVILSKVYFYILHSTFPFLFNPSQSKAGVINQIFEAQKKFFCSFQLFENDHIHSLGLMLIKVVKLDVEKDNIFSTLSNVVNRQR